MKRGITLLGMPASGKTTVGQLVADELDFEFLDVDQWMVRNQGMSVPEIISRRGREYILALEASCIADADLRETVVSPPGSIVYTDILPKLRSQTALVLLDVPFAELERRLEPDTNNSRGIIGLGQVGLRGLYDERIPLYLDWADAVLDCTDKSPQMIAEDVIVAAWDFPAR